MPELCHRQIIRQQQIMKKSALTVLIALLPLAATAQTPSINGNGKKIEKEKMESKDYLPKIHGTIRAKYEYQTTMGAGRFDQVFRITCSLVFRLNTVAVSEFKPSSL